MRRTVLFTLVCCFSAHAATCIQPLCVNRIDDSAAAPVSGMLRYAVLNAPPGAQITFDPALANATITIDGSSPNNHIKISQDLTIQGPGSSLLTISGGNLTRIFFIASNNVQINGVTLANGYAKGGNGAGGGGGAAGMGGAIFLYNGYLQLNGVTLSGNVAQGGAGGSGAYLSGAGGGFGGDATTQNSGSVFGAGPAGDLPGGMGGADGFGVNCHGGPGGSGGFGGGGGAGGSTGGEMVCSFAAGGAGGFGGGGGSGGTAGPSGFGGGAGAVDIFPSPCCGGGGGAGLGGAVFASGGYLSVTNSIFQNNTVTAGTGGTAASAGQAKGAALFLCSSSFCGTGHDALASLFGTTFQNSTSPNAGTSPACPARDDPDVCGSISGPATHFSVAVPSTLASGVPFQFTVTALDANNAVDFLYTGIIHFTSTDAAAFLPSNGALGFGVLTFPATLHTGTQTITATDTVRPAITGTSAAISVLAPGGAGPLSPVSVTPGAGSGASQTFTFTFHDPAGIQDLSVLDVLINNSIDGRNACYFAFVLSSQRLFLVDNSGDAGGPFADNLTNTQCSLSLQTAGGSGLSYSLVVRISFNTGGAFDGHKVIYMAARNAAGQSSGWQALGTWESGPTSYANISIGTPTPANGGAPAGTPATFAIPLSDSKGTADVGIVDVLFNSALDGRQACYVAYVTATNTLYLVNDAGQAGGPFAGAQNSQCAVTGAISSAGNNLTLTLNVTFFPAFTGNRILYVAARNAAGTENTGWQSVGAWQVQ